MAAFGFFKSNNNDNQATGRQIMMALPAIVWEKA